MLNLSYFQVIYMQFHAGAWLKGSSRSTTRRLSLVLSLITLRVVTSSALLEAFIMSRKRDVMPTAVYLNCSLWSSRSLLSRKRNGSSRSSVGLFSWS